MEFNELLQEIDHVDIFTKKSTRGFFAGNFNSIFQGRGFEFYRIREYVVGDDIHTIDWNASARFNKFFIKEFVEERDLDIIIFFDHSSSMLTGYKNSKKDSALKIIAMLMFTAVKNNDNIGLCLFSNGVEKFFKPKKGRKHAVSLLKIAFEYTPQSKLTDIKTSLLYATRFIKKHSIIIIVSDFIAESFTEPLKLLKKHHDVILISLSDIIERNIPDIGFASLIDSETNEQIIINTSNDTFRKEYSSEKTKIENYLKKDMQRLGIGFIPIRTENSLQDPIKDYFRIKKRK